MYFHFQCFYIQCIYIQCFYIQCIQRAISLIWFIFYIVICIYLFGIAYRPFHTHTSTLIEAGVAILLSFIGLFYLLITNFMNLFAVRLFKT